MRSDGAQRDMYGDITNCWIFRRWNRNALNHEGRINNCPRHLFDSVRKSCEWHWAQDVILVGRAAMFLINDANKHQTARDGERRQIPTKLLVVGLVGEAYLKFQMWRGLGQQACLGSDLEFQLR